MDKQSILIIEDDIDLLEIEQLQLETAGYAVKTAKSIAEANEVLANQKFHCILLDMNLEGASGKEIILLTKQLHHKNYNTPIIIVSGDLNIELIQEVREKISSILVKPFNSADLIEKIQKSIKKAQSNNKNSQDKSGKNIFIVDDDKEYVRSIKSFLEAERLNVVCATNSQDATIKLQNQKFDLLLVDFDIDHRSGEWIVNLLRKSSGHLNHKTPIFIVSGFANSCSPDLQHKVQKIIEKPISLAHLTKELRDELSKAKEKKIITKVL